MIPKKKGAPAPTTQEAPQQNISTDNIAEPTEKGKAEKKKKLKYNLESSMKTMSVKIYAEQIGQGGLDEFSKIVKQIDENKMQVIAIIHDRDFQGDDFFLPSKDKPHMHIIERSVDGVPRKIRTLLKMLKIELRPEEDANLWEHAIDKVGHFEKYAAYLTHETKDAVDAGKAKYEVEELISNLSKEDIRALQLPYIYTGKVQPEEATMDEQANWRDMAREAGYNMEPYDEFEDKVPLVVMKSIERFIKRAYDKGLADRVEEARKSDFTRCAIFIKGSYNQGKTYAAVHALDDFGYKTLYIDSGTKTGKFDKLTAHHRAMVVDDATVKNVLGLADDKPIECYRRNSSNPYFIGEYLIITSNVDFEEWCRMCGIDKDEHLKAARSRFYVCETDELDGEKYLLINSWPTRGKDEKLAKKDAMMVEFKQRFEAIFKQYKPTGSKLDRSALWASDPVPKEFR